MSKKKSPRLSEAKRREAYRGHRGAVLPLHHRQRARMFPDGRLASPRAPEDRVSTHNWAIAQELPRATKEAYCTAITKTPTTPSTAC